MAALAVLVLPALWLGQFVPGNLRRPEDVPYWQDAARHLDRDDRAGGRVAGATSDGTRVLAIPGSDFASYRWGNTVDPILPGLMGWLGVLLLAADTVVAPAWRHTRRYRSRR